MAKVEFGETEIDGEKYLSTLSLAKQLKVKTDTVRRWLNAAKKNGLHGINIGGQWYIPQKSITAMLLNAGQCDNYPVEEAKRVRQNAKRT